MSSNDDPDIPQPHHAATLSDPILRNIGLVAALWSALEAQLEISILRLQDIKLETGMVLSSTIGFRSRIGLLRTFANEGGVKPENEAKALLDLLKRMEAAYLNRNLVVHAFWTPTDDPNVGNIKGVRATARLRVINEPMTVDGLAKIADEIHHIGADMLAFMERQRLVP